MKRYVVSRKTQADYQQMSAMYAWLRKNYGESKFQNNWAADWAWEYGDGRECVEFRFYDESIATAFVLIYGKFIIKNTEDYETFYS